MATALTTPENTANDNRAVVTTDRKNPVNVGFYDVIGDMALMRKRQREQTAVAAK